MKSYLSLFILSLGLMMMFSCSSTSDAYQEERTENEDEGRIYYDSLADFLKKESGLRVQGSGNSAKITIRGVNTIKLDTEPLYVIDGVPIGNSYSQANSAVNPNNISSVDVIKSANAITLYGERSRNGVIVIKTRQSKRLNESANKN